MGSKVNQIIETLSIILITRLFIKSVLNYYNTLILINQRKRIFFIKYFSFLFRGLLNSYINYNFINKARVIK